MSRTVGTSGPRTAAAALAGGATRCLLVAAGLLACRPAAGDDAGPDRLKLIAHTYLANREAFTQLTCRFHVTYAQADRVEDIPAGDLKDRLVVRGLWLLDAPRVRLELTCNRAAVAPRWLNEHAMSARFLPSVYLGDSRHRLTVSPVVGLANVHPPESYAGLQGTPFDMNWMGDDEKLSPARLILHALTRKDSSRYLGEQTFEGKKVVVVEVDQKEYLRTYTFRMDPDKAFWPVETVITDEGKPSMVVRITDVRAAANGHWYPAAGYWFQYPNALTPTFSVRQFVVDELRLGPPTGAKDFCVTLPVGVTVKDAVTTGAQFTHDQDTEYCLGGLPALVARCRLAGEERRAMLSQPPPAQQEAVSAGSRRWLVTLLACLAAVCFVGWGTALLVRRHRAGQPAPGAAAPADG